MMTSPRLANLDALRGLAALLVVWQHTSEYFVRLPHLKESPHWLADIAWTVDFGRIGVVCFFLISGFVIPFSLKPAHPEPLKHFVVRRFFRLYPAYWLSVLLATLVSTELLNTPVNDGQFIANLSMVQSMLGYPHLQGLYWTLQVELIFYALCAALFHLERLHQARTLFLMVVILFGIFVLLQALIWHTSWLEGVNSEWRYMPYYLSIMFLGTLYRKYYDAPYPSAQLKAATLGATGLCLGLPLVALAMASLGVELASHTHPLRFGAGHALAFVLFAAGILWRCAVPRFALWLGTVSYSLYLFHPVAMNLVYYYCSDHRILGESRWSLGSYMGITTLLSVGLAAAVYYAIEKPAIRFSHRS